MTAVIPFVVGMLLRLILTRRAITVGTMWFAFNVLMAPVSTGIRLEPLDLGNKFR